MTIKFLLMINRNGATRVARYYDRLRHAETKHLEDKIISTALSKSENDAPIFNIGNYNVVYKRYACLFIFLGADKDEDTNNLVQLEFIHLLVEIMDSFFENVCEMDILNNLHFVYITIDEMINNGIIIETNKDKILNTLNLVAKTI